MNRFRTISVLTGLGAALVVLGCAGISTAGKQVAVKADVFVAQGGTGSGDGKSCDSARSVSYLNTAANWGPGKAIALGVVVALCGTLTSSVAIQGSGSPGKPVTILFAPGAKISQPACDPCVQMGRRSYITIDGGANG